MKHSASPLVLVGLLASLGGCAPPGGATGDDLDPDGSDLGAARSALEAPACGGRRWVSLGDPGSCVSQGGFDAEPLFPAGQMPPAPLAGYCLHTWASAGAPDPAELDAWEDAFAPGTLAEDCALVTPLGGWADHLAAFLHDSIAARIGVVSGPPVGAPDVHVAVLDTTPDAPSGAPETGTNRHGDTLAALIGEVVDVPGAVAVSTSLAMPYFTDPQSGEPIARATGGDFGYVSDLARALWRAIRYHDLSHAGERLVLNLSLGWEPLGASSACVGSTLPAAAAVRDVLDIAACSYDALIVAAAGNDTGGPSPATGLMCPAAWMTQTPSCAPGRPLVIAAYGLDYADNPLEVARLDSSTPFAAPALGGIAWPAGSSRPPPLTGTSVSAAAVTASLAAVWAAEPSMPSDAVVHLLHMTSPTVGPPAQVCAPGIGPCDVRRISPCGALDLLGSPWTCTVSSAVVPGSNPGLDPTTWQSFLTTFSNAQTAMATPSAGPLPSQISPTAAGQNTVHPQPLIPVCPTCAVSLGFGSAASNPSLCGMLERSVTGLAAVVRNDDGSYSSYSISGVSTGTAFRAALPSAAGSTRSAWISATDSSTGLAIVEQILVVQ